MSATEVPATEMLSTRALNRALLARQFLLGPRAPHDVTGLVEHLVGLQAQAPFPPYYGLWSRIAGFEPGDLAALISDRSVVRIALMRSTIHLVSARDCLPLRALMRPVIERGFRANHGGRLPGVDLAALAAAGRALVESEPMTFRQLGDALAERWPGCPPADLAQGVRALVPLVQVPPRAVWGRSGRSLHTSAEAWIAASARGDLDLAGLARRYLAAFGPATAADVRAWSGLTGLRAVLDALRPELITFRSESGAELFDLPDAPRPPAGVPAPPRLVAEFDNLVLSHADRTRIVAAASRNRLYSVNGIFPGTVLLDGFVAGMWRLATARGTATLTVEVWDDASRADLAALTDEAERLLAFAAPDAVHDIRFAPVATSRLPVRMLTGPAAPCLVSLPGQAPMLLIARNRLYRLVIMGLELPRQVVALAVSAVTVFGASVTAAVVHPGASRTGAAAGPVPRDTGARADLAARAAVVISAGLTGFAIPVSRALREPLPAAAVSPPASASPPAPGNPAGPAAVAGTPPRQLIVPDIIAAVPAGVSAAQVAAIGKLAGVRATLPVDGGAVTVNGTAANVIGVSPQAFRSWTPPETAAAAGAWTNLANGDMLASNASAGKLGLKPGGTYAVSGAAQVSARLGATVPLSIPGIDVVVGPQRSAQLGLVKNVAVLINAPGANLTTLMGQVRSVIGSAGKVVNLVPVVAGQLPVVPASIPAGQVPSNYLQLYKDSAAEYCPGLSWTVLAAIGEIESGNGANDGPSTAGALGPMQFLPSTWAIWGIDGFGQNGSPDIMNPLDAVPSAARMLCADGATNGTAGLSAAIFDYNHATWYVNEVLELATEYAQDYA